MIVVNLSPNYETSLGFDGVSNPNSWLHKSNTRIYPSQHKTKQSSHKYETNQIKYELNLTNNS